MVDCGMIHHLMPNHLTRARRVLDLEIAALRDVKARLDDQFTSAVDLLAATVQRNARLIVTGVGKSGHIAAKLAATFTSTGAPAHFSIPSTRRMVIWGSSVRATV